MIHYPAKFWYKIDEEHIKCDLCPRHCITKHGQRGYCGVRENVNGQLMSLVYGRTSGFCIDPVEKKPLFHFYPGSATLSFGTGGCNLGCIFCQNWQITKTHDFSFLTEHASPDMIVKAAKQYNCDSISFTYNEPVIFAEYAIDVARLARANNIKTIVVTSGYITQTAAPEFFEYMDAANIDLKGFNDKFCKDFLVAELQPFLDTLMYVKHKTKTWLEITNLLIPGENDHPDDVHRMTKWIRSQLGADIPVHFSAFAPNYKLTDKPPTSLRSLIQAREIALANGLRYVYTGNISNETGETTFCHHCKTALIERQLFEVTAFKLKKSLCPQCQTRCTGHFSDTVGNWGNKRQPVKIGTQ